MDAPLAAATNLLRWTADLQRAPWEIEGLTGAHAGQSPSPFGVRDGHLLQESKGAGPHGIAQPFECPAAGPFTASIYIRSGTRTCCVLQLTLPGGNTDARFDLAGRTVKGAKTPAAARIEGVGKGWVRIQASGTASGQGPGRIAIHLLDRADGEQRYEGDGGSGMIVWGPLVEAGTVATCYVPTFFIPETRAADEPVTAPSP